MFCNPENNHDYLNYIFSAALFVRCEDANEHFERKYVTNVCIKLCDMFSAEILASELGKIACFLYQVGIRSMRLAAIEPRTSYLRIPKELSKVLPPLRELRRS